jgi:hypothetical protein
VAERRARHESGETAEDERPFLGVIAGAGSGKEADRRGARREEA